MLHKYQKQEGAVSIIEKIFSDLRIESIARFLDDPNLSLTLVVNLFSFEDSLDLLANIYSIHNLLGVFLC